MVKICNEFKGANVNVDVDMDDLIQELNISHPLYDFQKWGIKAIVTGNHLLVCCPTGSGKTFCGEYAFLHAHKHHKKAIYNTPIKALSNEKYHSFSKKYPHISFGLITGDIKLNPTADVLIMTTEILLNKLCQTTNTTANVSSMLKELDFEDVGAVIFDEIHMINDEHRGHVWEQTIMQMPPHIQMVGLSATLDNPIKFAQWIENTCTSKKKEVYYVEKTKRAVPLRHYAYLCSTAGVFKTIKDKILQQKIKANTNQLLLLQGADNQFLDKNYQSVLFVQQLFAKHRIVVKRSHVLNQLATYLFKEGEAGLLPALCYVFSRKQVEQCARELTVNLLEFDSKIPYTVARECEQILREKLVNFEEYLFLPEYVTLVQWLQKGVAIHHAGMMPVLREMVELLFNRGFVKMLFCTETMSVGINLPVKTTIFTDLEKYNGEEKRYLLSHEYTQAAGRAGRLGLDKEGHVIHLNNLFSTSSIPMNTYRQIMNGFPQTLVSKFQISPMFLLNYLLENNLKENKLEELKKENNLDPIIDFLKQSLMFVDIQQQQKQLAQKIKVLESELETTSENNHLTKRLTTPTVVLEEYQELVQQLPSTVNKARRAIEKRIAELTTTYPLIQTDKINYYLWKDKYQQIKQLEAEKTNLENYIVHQVQAYLHQLQRYGFVNEDLNSTTKGYMATQLREIPGFLFAELYPQLLTLDAEQLVCLFGCFAFGPRNENTNKKTENTSVVNSQIMENTKMWCQTYQEQFESNKEKEKEYFMQTEMMPFMSMWCKATNVEECKWVLQQLKEEQDMFVGEFVKALLKIHNIGREFELIAEHQGDIQFLQTLKQMDVLLLKYIVTNQSLYI